MSFITDANESVLSEHDDDDDDDDDDLSSQSHISSGKSSLLYRDVGFLM
jgi:hypothetical protein